MKRLFAIAFLWGFMIPCSYGETITYGSGKYVGDVVNGVPHGHGTYFYANGSKYVGEYKDDLKHGQGIYFYGMERGPSKFTAMGDGG